MTIFSSIAVGQIGDAKIANKAMYSAFIYAFTQDIDWPKEHKSGDFVIGVYGDEDLYNSLIRLSSRQVGSQPIKVVRYISSSEDLDCHLLYVSSSKSQQIKVINKNINQKKTLVVTNDDGQLNNGAIFNFVVRKNALKYEINFTKAEKHNFIIGESLKKRSVNTL